MHRVAMVPHRVVLACDCDAFFCQVEQLRNPQLAGKPLAIQQHSDIIAANDAAKKAGVKKHMAPSEARAILHKIGGQVVHVFCEEGFRVSYRPYREVSGAFIRLLKSLPDVEVVEKASIDEAYVLMRQHGATLDVQQALDKGLEFAQQIRTQVKRQLGICVSVGVSTNKLLAKLATRPAKPDGAMVLPPPGDQLIPNLPVNKLPGMGGKVSMLLAEAGLHTCALVSQRLFQDPGALLRLGLPQAKATLLEYMLRGEDASEVQDRGPPKSFQVQMTLTPVPIPAPLHIAAGQTPLGQAPSAPAAAAGRASDAGDALPQSMLQPLPVQGPDTRPRLSTLLHNMCRDLVSRVVLDRHEEGRWPRRMRVHLHAQQPDGRPINYVMPTAQGAQRSAVFPSAALLDSAPRSAPGVGATSEQQHPAAPAQTGQSDAGWPHTGIGSVGPAAGPTALVVSERLYDPYQGITSPSHRARKRTRVGATGSDSHDSGGEGTEGVGPSHCDLDGVQCRQVEFEGVELEGRAVTNPGVSAVLQAVHGVANSLAHAVLQRFPPSYVVVQVAVEASGMVPVEQASAPVISRFTVPLAAAAQRTNAPGQEQLAPGPVASEPKPGVLPHPTTASGGPAVPRPAAPQNKTTLHKSPWQQAPRKPSAEHANPGGPPGVQQPASISLATVFANLAHQASTPTSPPDHMTNPDLCALAWDSAATSESLSAMKRELLAALQQRGRSFLLIKEGP